MKEQILDYLDESKKAVSFSDLKNTLQINNKKELKILSDVLNELEEDFLVYKTKKEKYMLFTESHLKKGRLIGHKRGFGFVVVDGEDDVFVSEKNLNGAIHDDEVILEILGGGGRLEGRVLKVVKRNLKQVVGDFYFRRGKGRVLLDDDKVNLTIIIDSDKIMGAVNGSKVLVKIAKKIKNNYYHGEIIRVLGHKNDPGVDVLAIVYKYNLEDVFSDKTMKEVNQVASQVTESEIKNRRDLRDKMIFTIDGDDTKDIDDALSLEVLKNGNYLLGVHIADVSYYVSENSAIEEDAFKRATSLYLADRVIPMLPHKLSNGICSLNPKVDRLAMSCVMEIDQNGKVVDYEIFESVIRSQMQMTYNKVNAILEENKSVLEYQSFVETLKSMNKLAKILRKKKERRGYIDFAIDEAKIIVNEQGEAIDVKLREQKTGEKLIEDFMIAANETVAEAIFHLQLPFIYRVHGKPEPEKITNFLNFARILGYNVNVPRNIKNFKSSDMQEILNQLDNKKEFPIFSRLLLRSMQKAVYDPENIGHFGLASQCYTHFTSPIRRYPDLTVHRLLRKYLFKKEISKKVIAQSQKQLLLIADQSSHKERAALECEREVTDMKKAEYMMNHIGEEYQGIISSVMSFGLFVEIDKGIEGLIRIDDLDDDYYYFEESSFSLRGRGKKKIYRLGDEIKVVVKSASKEAKTIDFVVAKED